MNGKARASIRTIGKVLHGLVLSIAVFIVGAAVWMFFDDDMSWYGVDEVAVGAGLIMKVQASQAHPFLSEDDYRVTFIKSDGSNDSYGPFKLTMDTGGYRCAFVYKGVNTDGAIKYIEIKRLGSEVFKLDDMTVRLAREMGDDVTRELMGLYSNVSFYQARKGEDEASLVASLPMNHHRACLWVLEYDAR